MYVAEASIKKPDKELELQLENNTVKSSNVVEILGLSIDQHLSFKHHIDRIVRKCHGLLGVLQRARSVLPLEFLKLSYIALVRPHLEYCNLAIAGASKTNLSKLDTVQKIASRLICREARDAHAEPLLKRLNLQTIKERRKAKTIKMIHNILNENCHPYLLNMFSLDDEGLLSNKSNHRTTFGRKRFSIYAKDVYNNDLLANTLE